MKFLKRMVLMEGNFYLVRIVIEAPKGVANKIAQKLRHEARGKKK